MLLKVFLYIKYYFSAVLLDIHNYFNLFSFLTLVSGHLFLFSYFVFLVVVVCVFL